MRIGVDRTGSRLWRGDTFGATGLYTQVGGVDGNLQGPGWPRTPARRRRMSGLNPNRRSCPRAIGNNLVRSMTSES